jgi:hypothetical protein
MGYSSAVRRLVRSSHLVRIAATLSMAAQLLSYPNLWHDRHLPSGPPTVPLWSWLPALPEPGGVIVWGSMLGALALLITGKLQRGAAIFVATAYAVMCILDQTRFQPYHTFCPVVLLVVTSPGLTTGLTLKAVRLMLGSVYFLAGMSKLNALYAAVVHPAMMAGIIERVPAFLEPVFTIPWMVPVIEMAMGLLVLYPGRWKWRPLVIALVLGVHAFIITMLLLADHDLAVIAFNLGLAVCVFVALFDSSEPDSRIPYRRLSQTFGGKLAIAHAIVVPVLALIGLVDMFAAHTYYSGCEGRMRWYATSAAVDRLLEADWPPEARQFLEGRARKFPPGARPVRAGMYDVPLHYWYDDQLGQGQIGEARIADTLKDRLCAFAARSPDDIIVRYYGPADVTGNRRYRDVNCNESLGFWLRLGGIATVVIGGDGEIYKLDQGGNPSF